MHSNYSSPVTALPFPENPISLSDTCARSDDEETWLLQDIHDIKARDKNRQGFLSVLKGPNWFVGFSLFLLFSILHLFPLPNCLPVNFKL